MITGHDLGTGPVLLRLRDIYKFGAAENQTTVSLIECKVSGKQCAWNACLTLVEEIFYKISIMETPIFALDCIW